MGFQTISIDSVKEYWNRRPCNIRHSLAPVGTKEYFDQVEERKYFVEPHIPSFAQFENWRGKRVLEIGCGIGTDTINFARAGAFVTAVELSEKSMELAKKRAVLFGLQDRITFVLADAEKLAQFIPEQQFDLIYSFGVLHHTPNPEKAFLQILKLSHPGTTVKIMVYHRRSWKVLWILLTYGKCRFWRLTKIVARHSEAQTGCPVTYIYTKLEGQKLLNDIGFKITNVQVEHIFPFRIKDYIQYRYVKVWYFRFVPERFFHWLEHKLGWHLCITAILP
jgi:2-polyprenyl-3-methyl-5-hydroxy-6-metoxy-1,4-benzoquinol methylase